MIWGLFSIVNTQDKRIKNNHLNGILIKMRQNPFSQRDTEMEKASHNTSFLVSDNQDEPEEKM